MLTKDEAYEQLGHSASLLKAVLDFGITQIKSRSANQMFESKTA
jgi:hypothetical protein